MLKTKVFIEHFSFIMSSQAKISAFFTHSGVKRSAASDENSCQKRQCVDQEKKPVSNTKPESLDNSDQENKPVSNTKPESLDSSDQENKPVSNTEPQSLEDRVIKKDTTPLSPEQKKKIEENRRAALAKLNTKKTDGLLVNVGTSWYNALDSEFSKSYFTELSKFVASERSKKTIYPPADQVFSWTNYCNIRDVKVVILGQDPYHGPQQAHGLCFSVQKGIRPPPSLENMYKELINDIEGFKHPGHGTLIGWAKQGVLLLNACLTVRAHEANSHKDKGWEKLTDAVISWLNKNNNGIIFMLWGAYAQKKGAFIDKKRHHILKSVHPSPLSAHKGFLGCKHFSQCNELLKKDGKKPIDWNYLPPQGAE